MNAREQGKFGELFEFVSNEGVRWLFVTLPDDRWTITRNGERVATGSGERRSLEAGVAKFIALTHAMEGATTCDPLIQEHVNRIQRDIRGAVDGKGMIETLALQTLPVACSSVPRVDGRAPMPTRAGGLR